MDSTFWHKQTVKTPLFPDLLWSRPENKSFAGKLLIIGGNAQGFAAPAEAYMQAERAGAGTVRVILPQAVKKIAGSILTTVEYALSNPSGGFSQMALGELLEQAAWADGVLLAGDFGRNSETAIVLEKFLVDFKGPLTLTKDAVDYFTTSASSVVDRAETTLVLSFAQLQKLATNARFATAFTFDMDFLRLIEALHEFTQKHRVYIITKHLETVFVATSGQVSTTKLGQDIEIWRVKTAAVASVWLLQNSTKPFAAFTTAVHELAVPK